MERIPVSAQPGSPLEKPLPRGYVEHSCCVNCVLTTALAAILCRNRCNANQVIAEFAFFPPNPSYYTPRLDPVSAARARDEQRVEVNRVDFNYRELDADPHYSRFKRPDGLQGRPRAALLRTSRGESVPSFFFHSANARLVVLYLHANATDCGAMLPTYEAFSRVLGVALLAVEYSGYGGASGRPSVLNTFADAKAGYDELIRRGFRPDQIVLYGQSVGSGPACHLAARRPVRAVVLHSPIASGIRALTAGGCCSPVNVYACIDPYNNLRELRRVKAPVLIVHGTSDEEIPFAHGEMLYAAARDPHEPFWVAGAGHNNVVETAEAEYFKRLAAFFATLLDQSPPA